MIKILKILKDLLENGNISKEEYEFFYNNSNASEIKKQKTKKTIKR